jgi:hypothetical protein
MGHKRVRVTMGYGMQESVSYEVQPTSDQECTKRHYAATKMSEHRRIPNIAG